MPPTTNFFGGLQPQPSQPGQQMQGVGQRAGPPVPASNYNLPSTAFPNVPTSGGGSGSGGPTTNSPHPPASVDISAAGASLPAIPSPLDSKKDVKLLSPSSSSGYQGSSTAAASSGPTTNSPHPSAIPSPLPSLAGSSQSGDPLLQGGGIPSLPSVKMEVKEEPPSSSGLPTSSPHPRGLPSLPSVKMEVKEEPSSSCGGLATNSPRPPPSAETNVTTVSINKKIVPDPALRKGEK